MLEINTIQFKKSLQLNHSFQHENPTASLPLTGAEDEDAKLVRQTAMNGDRSEQTKSR
jgi:hypothetical protein